MILLRKINKVNNFVSKFSYSTVDNHVKNKSINLDRPVVARTDSEHELLYTMKPDMPENPKVLKICILGAPNAGKSTIVNRLLNRRISSVSSKVNTTRNRLTGVLTDNDTQLIFLDTPGIIPLFKKLKRFKQERSLILDPRSSLWEADVICVVQDGSDIYRRHKIDLEVLKCLYMHPEKESILIVNKIDLLRQKKHLFDLVANLTDGQLNGSKFHIKDTRPISLETKLEQIYLNTAKKLGLQLNGETEKEAIKLLEELKECENKLLTSPDYLSSFEKESDEIEEGEKTGLVRKLEENRMSLEKITNKNDPTPYETVNDITAQEFKQDLMKTTDWHLYYEKLNKLDLLVRDRKSWSNFNQVFLVSAKTNDGVDDLKRYLFARAQPGDWVFPRSMVTDQMPKDIALACVREKMLEYLPEEVPYVLHMDVQYWSVDVDDSLNIVINVYPRKQKYKRDLSSLLKNGGRIIKAIADEARQEMMNTFRCEVSLKLIAVTDLNEARG